MATLGQRIKKLRSEKKLSQTAFGEIFGVKHGAVSSWELDKVTIDNEIIKSMADFFGITPQELQYGNTPIIVNEPPEGYEIIPTREYIEFLKYKAEKGEKAEKALKESKNIEVVSE